MKKIICALTVGAMICGAAFADVSFALAYRQRANLYTNFEGTKNTLYEDVYDGSGTDNLAISLSGDVASFDVVIVGDEATTAKLRAKTLGASVFLNNLTLFSGYWSDGKANGAYRVKSDGDAGNLEGPDFEYKKLGSAYKNSPSIFVDNPVGYIFGDSGGSERFCLGATYNVKMSDGAVAINGVCITNETSSTTNGANTTPDSMSGHGFNVLVDGRKDGLGMAEVVFKYGDWTSASSDGDNVAAMAFGAYVQPTITRNLILTVGGAGSTVGGKFTDYSADLRARYQVIPKKLSVSSFHNFSALNSPDSTDADNWYKKEANAKLTNDTVKGLADKTDSAGKCAGTTMNRDQIMSNNILVRYNVNDKVSVFGIVADMVGMGKNAGQKIADKDGELGTKALVELRASGWAQFFATPMCTVTAGCVYEFYDATKTFTENGFQSWSVPVIVRVRM
jgi:hypothetical protein